MKCGQDLFELLIWPQEVTLARWTQPSGPLCLWQCFLCNCSSQFSLQAAANQSCSFNIKTLQPIFFYHRQIKLNTIRSKQIGVKKCCSTAKKIISQRIPTILRCTESMVLYWAPERQVSCWLLVSGDWKVGLKHKNKNKDMRKMKMLVEYLPL